MKSANGEKQNNSGEATNSDTVDFSGYHGMYLGSPSGKRGNYWWWLASPSASDAASVCTSEKKLCPFFNDYVSAVYVVCPAVSLKSGVQLEIVDE